MPVRNLLAVVPLLIGKVVGEDEMQMFAQVARDLLSAGDSFIDVGARNGVAATLIAADIVGPRGRVIAIEPDASCFARLSHNVHFSGRRNVRCLNMNPFEGLNAFRLDRILDRYMQEGAGLVRVDAPGAEVEVLQSIGARVNDANAPSFVFQTGRSCGEEAGVVRRRLYMLLEAADYVLEQHRTLLLARSPAAAARRQISVPRACLEAAYSLRGFEAQIAAQRLWA